MENKAFQNVLQLDAIKGGQIFHFSYTSSPIKVAQKRGGGKIVTITKNCRAHSKQSYTKACREANPDYTPSPQMTKDSEGNETTVYEHISGHVYRHIEKDEIVLGISIAKSDTNPVIVERVYISPEGKEKILTVEEFNDLVPASKRTDYVNPKAKENNEALRRTNEERESQGKKPIRPIPSFKWYKPQKIQINKG